MTLGAAAAAQVRLIAWCKALPAPRGARYRRYGRSIRRGHLVLDWRERFVCSVWSPMTVIFLRPSRLAAK